jgi:N6-adenosine-specific RNA methylase IME4
MKDLGKFQVITADCPWRFQNWSDRKNGAAAACYDTMTAQEIADIPVDMWADKDCTLYLWGVWTQMKEALQVMEGWGFELVTGVPWVKTTPSKGKIHCGVGFWIRGASEYLLVGRRGNPKRGKIDVIGLLHDFPQQFWAPIGEHSFKPIRVTTWIEYMFPEAKRLELFGRRERAGWTVLGRKLGYDLGPWGVRPYVAKNPSEGLFHK